MPEDYIFVKLGKTLCFKRSSQDRSNIDTRFIEFSLKKNPQNCFLYSRKLNFYFKCLRAYD